MKDGVISSCHLWQLVGACTPISGISWCLFTHIRYFLVPVHLFSLFLSVCSFTFGLSWCLYTLYLVIPGACTFHIQYFLVPVHPYPVILGACTFAKNPL